jgi:hypothetical protein
MSISSLWSETIAAVHNSAVYRGTIVTGTLLLISLGIILALLCVTFFLRQFFKRHPLVNRIHRILIYLLTMGGVLALFIAGLIGIVLPIIPGIIFILIGLLLMRRYHRWVWLDEKIMFYRKKMRKSPLWIKIRTYFRARKQEIQVRKERLQEKLNKHGKRPKKRVEKHARINKR